MDKSIRVSNAYYLMDMKVKAQNIHLPDLERFLQLCSNDNMQVMNCTTPANYFHALRRQMHRDFRKPLIMMTPKSLLRNKYCVSNLEDFSKENSFHRILWDHAVDPKT